MPTPRAMASAAQTMTVRFEAQGRGLHVSATLDGSAGRNYRQCENYVKHNVCNWAVPADDPNPLCLSCRLTRVIPDLGKPGCRADES